MVGFLDCCRFIPSAGGTTDWTYVSAVGGYQSPASANAVNNQSYHYRAESADLTQWEVGTGSWNSSTGVLTRATVLFNSAGTTSKIGFSTVPQVAIVALAEDINASTGAIGEFVSSSVASGSAVALTSGSAKDVTTISLTAGDWDVWGNVCFLPAGSTTVSGILAWINTAANTNPGAPNGGAAVAIQASFVTGGEQRIPAGNIRLSLAATTTVSLGSLATFATSTMSAYGFIGARRRSLP